MIFSIGVLLNIIVHSYLLAELNMILGYSLRRTLITALIVAISLTLTTGGLPI